MLRKKESVESSAADGTRKDQLLRFANDDHAMMKAYGKASLSALQENTYVTGVAAFTVIGALCFGIDQGKQSAVCPRAERTRERILTVPYTPRACRLDGRHTRHEALYQHFS